jgi:nucleotide-binding universal stress UspA family protein
MDLRKIIAALDFGPDTEKALAYTEWLADMAGAGGDVRLLHVMDYALTPPAYLLPYIEEEERQNRARLELLAVRLREKGVTVGCDVVLGRLVEAFDMYLSKRHADILVISHKSHIIRLSSSERLIRSLRQPMLVVRGAKSEGAVAGSVRIKKILCPIDFSVGSAKALGWAGYLAQENKSELIVLHVLSDRYLQFSLGKGHDEKDQEKYLSETTADAGEWLDRLVQGIDGVKRMVRRGDPCITISETGRDMDIDLIIMGARGSYLLSGLLLGSVSESVLRSSSCPVFIVH